MAWSYTPPQPKPITQTTKSRTRDDLEAAHVFRWVNTAMSNAKAMVDGTFHGRARRQFYLEEFAYRFSRRHFGTRIADRLLMACLTTLPRPYGT